LNTLLLWRFDILKAVVFHRPYHLAVEEVPDPKIEDPHDILVEVSSTAICGSDLHIYHGLVPHMHDGMVIGHEFMGRVLETGKEVNKWKKGERVLVPFPVACGECEMCRSGLWSHCVRSNVHGESGGIFGYGDSYGGYAGGQAEYVRVPYADISPIHVPDEMSDEQLLFLTDILPTAYWIVDTCGVKPGDSVAVYGCGPVGILAQRSALFKGAEQVFAIDHVPYRLKFAQEHNPGVIPINFQEKDPGETIQELTRGRGVDVAIEAVGFEAEPTNAFIAMVASMQRMGFPQIPGLRPEDQPALASVSAINWAVESLRHGGTLGLVGVYGGKANGFPIGDIFAKGITIRCGQALVQNYVEELLGYIRDGRIQCDDLITHRIDLDNALEGYNKFAKKEDNCVKVVMNTKH
jgi:S-(hydroxymethyl)glutathione dehydrogenase/alcohol dehydrogenase